MPIYPSFMFGRELYLRVWLWPTINPDVIMIFYQNVDILHCNHWEKWSNCWSGWQISRMMRTPWLIFLIFQSVLCLTVSQWASQTLSLVNCYHLTSLPAGNNGTWSRLNILIYPPPGSCSGSDSGLGPGRACSFKILETREILTTYSRQIYWVSVIKGLIYIPDLPIGFWNIFPWWES